MLRQQHLKAIYIVGSRKLGKGSVLVMLCGGPDCAGAEMLARPTVAAVLAEANTHIDKMDDLSADPS